MLRATKEEASTLQNVREATAYLGSAATARANTRLASGEQVSSDGAASLRDRRSSLDRQEDCEMLRCHCDDALFTSG